MSTTNLRNAVNSIPWINSARRVDGATLENLFLSFCSYLDGVVSTTDAAQFLQGFINATNPTDARTALGAAGKGRTNVQDANYAIAPTDLLVAMKTLTAPRTWTLPAAALYDAGQTLYTADESGSCSSVDTITIQVSGTDQIVTGGVTSVTMATAGAKLAWHSDGVANWTYSVGPAAIISAGAAAFSPLSINQGGGGLSQTLTTKALQRVDIRDFCKGMTANGDETAGFVKGIAEASAAGLALDIAGLPSPLLTGSVTLPIGFTLRGHGMAGQQYAANFYAAPSQLQLEAGATITVNSGCKIRDLSIFPTGLNFAATSDADLAALVASFRDTAITGNSITDTLLDNLFIAGFNQAVYMLQGGRRHTRNLFIDCTNGLRITDGLDTDRHYDNHAWPFLTAPKSTTTPLYARNGIAYRIGRAAGEPGASHDDWSYSVGNMAFGYYEGHRLENAANIRLIGCQADGVYADLAALGSDSCAYKIMSDSFDVVMMSCTGYGHATAIEVNSTSTAGGDPIAVTVQGGRFYGSSYGVNWQTGNLSLTAEPHISCANGPALNVGPSAGVLSADLGEIESTPVVLIDPAWAASGSIDLPTTGGWNVPVIVGSYSASTSGGITTYTTTDITVAQKSSLRVTGALPIHGQVTDRFTASPNIQTSNPSLAFYNTTGPTNGHRFNVLTTTISLGGTSYGVLGLAGYNDALSAGGLFFGAIGSAGTFVTLYSQALPVAASDSAAAALTPPIPVGGWYKTSAGAVMQRTT